MGLPVGGQQKNQHRGKVEYSTFLFMCFNKEAVINKSQIIKQIIESAKLYQKNLENQNILFVYIFNNQILFIETKFLKSNFLHLTGVKLNDKSISANRFFELCLKSKIKEENILLKKDGTTIQKMNVLNSIVQINKKAKMVGDFTNNSVFLQTNKIIGNSNCCLGLIPIDKYYVANTCLNQDIRKIIRNQGKIIAIFSKAIKDSKYNKLSYINKNYASQIKDEISILEKVESHLLE